MPKVIFKKCRFKKSSREEASLVKACVDYLTLQGHIAWRNNSGAIFLRDKGKCRVVRLGQPGSPDVVACLKGGYFLAIECKSKKGKLSHSQKDFLDKISSKGGIALVIRSIDELIQYLSYYQKKLKEEGR